MPTASETYSALVLDIMAELERGEMPWRRPWAIDKPGNLFTRRNYNGINALALMLAAQRRGYRSSLWLTEVQARERGGYVLPAERDHPVHIAMMYLRSFQVMAKDGRRVTVRKLAGRAYPVYNLEQTRGLGRLVRPARNLELWNLHCDRLVREWKDAPRVVSHPDRAFYRCSEDVVAIPDRDCFDSDSHYYSTLFHELIHSTGHPSRLDRKSFQPPGADFGSETYAFEELIAELGAAFLCSETGIGNSTLQDNAAYIGSWLKTLRRDTGKLFLAGHLAEKACNMVMGRTETADRVSEDKREAGGSPVGAAERDAVPQREIEPAHATG